MSQIIPWNDPGAAPCCCGLECAHTANFNDPSLWDPLTGGGFASASQIEITPEQYALFTAGGSISWQASGGASVSGSKNIPPGDLVLYGDFSFILNRTIEANFLSNSCKQKELQFQETAISTECASDGFSEGTNSEFYPYMELNYPCDPFSKVMSARFSFYNAPGITGGKLYDFGMYFNLLMDFRINRTLLYGIQEFSAFDLLLSGRWRVENNVSNPDGYVDLQTDAGTISLPYQKSTFSSATSSGTSTMIFTASPP